MWMLVALVCLAAPSTECTRVAVVVSDNPARCEAIARIAAADLKAKKMRLEEPECVRVEQS
jgi:hypothetical protein